MANFDVREYDRDVWGPYRQAVALRRPDPVKWRHSHLLNEAVRLYEAQSFLVWRYGVFFDTHITITPAVMGIVDHKKFAAMLPVFNKELKRWLALGNTLPRARWRKWLHEKIPQEHWYIYVIENALANGIHAHELCVVPKSQRQAFEIVVRDWWMKAVGHGDPDQRDGIKIRFGTGCHKRQVQWFRYLIKSVRRDAVLYDRDGLPRTTEEVFKPEPYWGTPPTYVPQLAGVSQSLNKKARAVPIQMGDQAHYFHSKIARRDLDDVYDGWEMEALKRRPAQRLIAAMEQGLSH